MATFDRKPWWQHERKPAERRLTLAAVESEPPPRSGALTWDERLAERERRLSQGSAPPRGWPPAAA